MGDKQGINHQIFNRVKNLLVDSLFSPLVENSCLIQIRASLHHRKKMKAEPSWLIPRKLTANL